MELDRIRIREFSTASAVDGGHGATGGGQARLLGSCDDGAGGGTGRKALGAGAGDARVRRRRGEEGGVTAPREGECRPETTRASARDGRRCCGEADVG